MKVSLSWNGESRVWGEPRILQICSIEGLSSGLNFQQSSISFFNTEGAEEGIGGCNPFVISVAASHMLYSE
jgi:hypothetical protein